MSGPTTAQPEPTDDDSETADPGEKVPEAPAPDAVDAYLAERAALTRRLHAVTASLTIEGTGDLPALMLAVRALRALAG